MKKNYCFIPLLFLTMGLYGQAPQKMSYQAVIRNSAGILLNSTQVGVKLSIIQGSQNGLVAYKETHRPSTNSNGLIGLEIGTGNVMEGIFSQIDWANGPYFIKTETDPTGGSNYTIVNTNELLSVPYALFSANGTPGPKGDKGDTGSQGIQGVAGVKGDTGLAGLKGDKGDTGSQGVAGVKGDTGNGIPTGGIANQILAKIDGTDFNTQWISPSSSISGWALDGNTGTTPTTNFIGTKDAQDFRIKTNDAERLSISSTGNIGVGTISPSTKLEVNGYIKLGNSDSSGDATPVPGMMRFNDSLNKFQGYVRDTDAVTPGDQSGWVNLN